MGTRLNLPAIRRNRTVSIHEIADRTKIGTQYLDAIESERWDLLPGEIYSISYIRQYAAAIDYDAGLILNVFFEYLHEQAAKELAWETNCRPKTLWSRVQFLFRNAPPLHVTPAPPPASGAFDWLLNQYSDIEPQYATKGAHVPLSRRVVKT